MKARPTVVIGTALSAIVILLIIAGATGIHQRIVAVQETIDEREAEGMRVWEKIEQYIQDNGHPPDTLQELHRSSPLTDRQVALFGMALGKKEPIDLSSYHFDPETGIATLTYSSWFWSNRSQIEPDGKANGSQPIRSETNSISSAAGSRR